MAESAVCPAGEVFFMRRPRMGSGGGGILAKGNLKGKPRFPRGFVVQTRLKRGPPIRSPHGKWQVFGTNSLWAKGQSSESFVFNYDGPKKVTSDKSRRPFVSDSRFRKGQRCVSPPLALSQLRGWRFGEPVFMMPCLCYR